MKSAFTSIRAAQNVPTAGALPHLPGAVGTPANLIKFSNSFCIGGHSTPGQLSCPVAEEQGAVVENPHKSGGARLLDWVNLEKISRGDASLRSVTLLPLREDV